MGEKGLLRGGAYEIGKPWDVPIRREGGEDSEESSVTL